MSGLRVFHACHFLHPTCVQPCIVCIPYPIVFVVASHALQVSNDCMHTFINQRGILSSSLYDNQSTVSLLLMQLLLINGNFHSTTQNNITHKRVRITYSNT